MSTEPVSVRISLKDGPVLIPSLNGTAVNGDCPLWDGITASESFPPGVESAYYVLSLEKPVSDAAEVSLAETDLIRAMEILATAWPFAGGSFIAIETRSSVVHPRFESNAKDVETELLARRGLKPVERSMSIACETLATYREPPLRIAAELAKKAFADVGLKKLLEYYHRAWGEYYGHGHRDGSSWFTYLYKVRDALCKIYRGEEAAKAALNISATAWRCFGKTLNEKTDLRHAEVTVNSSTVSPSDVDRLYRVAREWVVAHLVHQRLPVSR
jgi:hypothetical protein